MLRTGNNSGRMPDKKQSVRMVMPSKLTSTGLMPGCISLGGRVVRLRMLEQKAGDEAREKKKEETRQQLIKFKVEQAERQAGASCS